MEVKIDDYGRIVIPKEVRDHLGIESGRTLKISVETEGVNGGAITLRPKGQRPPLRRKGALLVHSGELAEEGFDVVEQIRTERTERNRRHAGLDE
jgi:AbrB family looped-hinge helix DNA binding protein